MLYLIPLIAASAPLFIWPIERVLPYPFIIEELVKALLIFPLIEINNFRDKLALVAAIAFLFTLTESVLYIFNIQEVGNITTFLVRILLTFPLHATTMLIMLSFASKKKKYLIPGIMLAMVIHFLFNFAIIFI